MGLIVLLVVPIGLCFYAARVATERGRSALAWIFLVALAGGAGSVIGSLLEPDIPVLLPLLLGSAAPIAVVLGLHRLPIGAVRLQGTAWQFDRLGASERVELSVKSGVRVRSKNGELIADSGDVKTTRADGECLVLDCGKEIGKLVLCPVGLPSREVRMRFVEALHERIQKS